jgi:hypothetical protein
MSILHRDKKDSKLSIISITQFTFGVEGKVGVVVGAGLASLNDLKVQVDLRGASFN